MDVLLPLLIFVTGLILGSFFNVVIYRLPREKSIVAPRSSCASCGTTLRAIDLIPVFSFIFLKGKCRYCNSKISFRYPLVELITGVIFVILYWKYGISIDFIFTVYLMSVLILVFFIDLDHMIIPNELVIAGLIGGILLFVLRFWFNDRLIDGAAWYSPLLGMVVTSGFLLLIALIGMAIYGTDAFGMGDVKIFLPIGLTLGFKLAVISLVFSVFIGGFAGLFLMITGLKHRKSHIPFGPFIVLGAFLSILFGHDFFTWYTGFL
ncbi:MAG: prepilin peptidase [Thermoanaerobacteraceae bacterium]|nr:prepilin peptidase [Thermoanaerobacteraceae bacterium]